ncbi:MAG TPA: AAA family ATPase, partial [Candidatus Acidoferrales bacterium]
GGRFKVVILDEAHMLTDEASNALLKTLEEPPDKVIFVMATTQPEDLADTIRSRSQHFHFRALSFAEISAALVDICAKENLTAETGAIGVMARAAEGSVRDGLSLLEQARAYCGSSISDAQVRELLGVVPAEILDELTHAIEERSAERVLSLVHRLLADGQNLQHFCREAIGHFRNLLVARVCGADSELIAAPADERPRLKKSAEFFSEEDLTRFFQILLQTDDDLRRKPDARLHMEMGLLRMVNAARLAPLEELLADLEGGAPSAPAPTRMSSASSPASGALPASSASVASQFPSRAATSAQPTFGGSTRQSSASSQGSAAAVAPARVHAAPPPRIENAAQVAAMNEESSPAAMRNDATVAAPTSLLPSAPAELPDAVGRSAGEGLQESQIDSIKSAIVAQEKFLGELVVHASRWEMSGGEIRLFFPMENRALAEMLQARDPMERLRNIAGRILGQTVRVCVKLEDVPVTGTSSGKSNGTRELRAKFEQDPIVRAMMERFGGQISDVKRRGEE